MKLVAVAFAISANLSLYLWLLLNNPLSWWASWIYISFVCWCLSVQNL